MTVPLLEFARLVVDGDVREASRRLEGTPGLATAAASVGATRQGSSTFFFADIKHYMYAGDTALHMAAAAFKRPVAEMLVKHGADCRARNRRGAEPLHYAADANHWDPAAQADTIAYSDLSRCGSQRAGRLGRGADSSGGADALGDGSQARFWTAGRT